jgi:hypothetical protein
MKIISLVLLPVLLLSSSKVSEQYPLQEKAINQSTIPPYVADYYHLAREYGEEIARRHNTYLNWVDFDASQWRTREHCRQVIEDSPKECKITIYPRNFRLGRVKES